HPWSLEQVASLSDEELLKTSQDPKSDMLPALVLARTYEASNAPQNDLLSLTEKTLDESFEAFKVQNFQLAKTKAVSAYLDGIEPLEPKLRLNDPNFTVQLETLLSSYRKQIDDRVTVEELQIKLSEIQTQLKDAKKLLESKPSSFGVTFSVSAGIFLREALEAALLLITLLGVVKTLGSRTAIYWIHAGWISASLVGLMSWFFSGWVMRLSGLRRELLEGSLSFFAVGILLYFGFWLHQKTEIGKWRSFINELVKNALDNKKMFGLALVAFMGVFREAFETVLFLRALLIESPGQETALGLGVLSAFLFVLVASSFAVKYNAKLPLKQLFSVSSIIMLFLAFVLVGKSVHAFQEAGVFSATPVINFIRIDLLGVFPTWESLLSQLVLLLVSLCFWLKPKVKVSHPTSANHS
ncbi:MAG: FTR1 family protein, partial [Deltaproteobacteria bacterium]